MADLDQRQQIELVVAIGRNIVKEIQPKELITYRSYSSLYLEKPEEVLKKQRSSDERTGFGVVETTLLITHIPQFQGDKK